MASLPTPSPFALALSQQLADLIQQKIKDSSGWISFAEFMHMALYTPGLGYYAGGAQKFGQAGDFVTAPEISPLFAQTLARQAAQVLQITSGNNFNSNILNSNILELGAGTGKLAADLLLELQRLSTLPSHYFILEVSDHLGQIQHETLQNKLPAALFNKVTWLQNLPEKFNGLIFANEVLDAIPVNLVVKHNDVWQERGVSFNGDFIWRDNLKNNVAALSQPNLTENLPTNLSDGYLTEVCPAALGLVRSFADVLETGVILLIDYGFGSAEYYHPQRNTGTLMCHYQHYAHSNPLINVGLQDITAHVNFSQIAQIASMIDMTCEPYGISLAGYIPQSQFLINCDILDILQRHSPDSPQFIKLAAAAQKLLSPAEMGDLFKVIAFSKNIDEPLIGFKDCDKSHVL